MIRISIAAVLVAAGTAVAGTTGIDRSGYEIYTGQATALDSATVNRGVAPLYDNIAGPYAAFAPSATNPIGVGDYNSIATNDILVDNFVFVGGVDVVGGVVFFDFFDAGGTFLDGFGVALPSAGNFIWTISPTDLTVAADGIVSMAVDDGTNGPVANAQWFLTENVAAVGDAGVEDVTGTLFNFAFGINGTVVPAPGAFALLGLGGLVATRRRR